MNRRADSLPPSILRSMRVLFDSLDTYRGGHIRIDHFATKWNKHVQQRANNRSASAPGEGFDKLPRNFYTCLQKVTPANGLITFERFCSALRLATAESARGQNGTNALDRKSSSHPVVEFRRNPYSSQPESVSSYNPVSKSHLVNGRVSSPPVPYKSPETQRKLAEFHSWYLERAVPAETDAFRHSRISSQSSIPDQQHRFSTEMPPKGLDLRPRNPKITDARLRPAQWEAKSPGHRFVKPPPPYHSSPSTSPLSDASPPLSPEVRLRKEQPSRAGEPDRRNTTFEEASLGVVNKHKRLLVEERELLRRGCEVSRKLSDWYGDRLAAIDRKERLVSSNVIPMDHGVHEERLNYLRAHVTEVNRRANALMESSEKGFPSALNMEFNRNVPQPADDQVRWLKNQVRLLSEEGRSKDARITLLEKERTQLLRDVSNWKCRVEASSLDFGRAEEATLI